MAEKPILKKDRTPSDQSSSDRPRSQSKDKNKRRGKGKGKGKGERQAKVPPINPALMRGPRPTKKVEPEEDASSEIAADAVETSEVEASTDPSEVAGTPAEVASDAAETAN